MTATTTPSDSHPAMMAQVTGSRAGGEELGSPTVQWAAPTVTVALAGLLSAGAAAGLTVIRTLAGHVSPVPARRRRALAVPGASRRFLTTVGLVPAVLMAAALAGCAPTPGGTASVTSGSFTSGLSFDAVGGRNNSITVALGAQGAWGRPSALLLTDARNPITPGPGCTRVDDNTVRCSTDGTTSIGFVQQVIRLGDGNDSYASSATLDGTTIHAGAGDDTVNGSATLDSTTIHAGAGDDTVNGGPSSEVIYEDSDSLDRDSFSGGGGGDWVLYAGVMHAVNISLNDTADDGRPGEGDNVKSDVENIGGTGNADTLTGNGQANTFGGPNPVLDVPLDVDQLTGGAVVNGGGGPDVIWGSNWGRADRLFGGTGDDTVYGFAGGDVVSGGAGNDTLWGHAGFDALDGGNETDWCNLGPDGGTAVNCESGP